MAPDRWGTPKAAWDSVGQKLSHAALDPRTGTPWDATSKRVTRKAQPMTYHLNITPQPKRFVRTKITIGVVACLFVLLIGLGALFPDTERAELRQMSCDQLTAEMLDMTGTTATEEYDLDRVKLINQTRDEKGCY